MLDIEDGMDPAEAAAAVEANQKKVSGFWKIGTQS